MTGRAALPNWVAKRDGRLASCATDSLPCTPERETVYAIRRMLGESLFHPDDRRYAPHLAWRAQKLGDAFRFVGVADERASARP